MAQAICWIVVAAAAAYVLSAIKRQRAGWDDEFLLDWSVKNLVHKIWLLPKANVVSRRKAISAEWLRSSNPDSTLEGSSLHNCQVIEYKVTRIRI